MENFNIYELIDDIKEDLSIEYSTEANNRSFERKVKAAIKDLKSAGVSDEAIKSDLGYMAIQIFVIDNWTIEAGKRVQSPIYLSYIVKLRNWKGDEENDESL